MDTRESVARSHYSIREVGRGFHALLQLAGLASKLMRALVRCHRNQEKFYSENMVNMIK